VAVGRAASLPKQLVDARFSMSPPASGRPGSRGMSFSARRHSRSRRRNPKPGQSCDGRWLVGMGVGAAPR
jgi:hypothetical protein